MVEVSVCSGEGLSVGVVRSGVTFSNTYELPCAREFPIRNLAMNCQYLTSPPIDTLNSEVNHHHSHTYQPHPYPHHYTHVNCVTRNRCVCVCVLLLLLLLLLGRGHCVTRYLCEQRYPVWHQQSWSRPKTGHQWDLLEGLHTPLHTYTHTTVMLRRFHSKIPTVDSVMTEFWVSVPSCCVCSATKRSDKVPSFMRQAQWKNSSGASGNLGGFVYESLMTVPTYLHKKIFSRSRCIDF